MLDESKTAKPITATVERIEVKTSTTKSNGRTKTTKSYEAYGSYTMNRTKYTDIKVNQFSTCASGRHSYYIKCEARNKDTGNMMYFTSDEMDRDLSKYQIATVPVYVDMKNPKKYHVRKNESWRYTYDGIYD